MPLRLDPFRDEERVSVHIPQEEAPWRQDNDQSVSALVNAEGGVITVPARDGAATIRVAYLFSGKSRRASIAEELRTLCQRSGLGLHFEQLDINVGGASHDLLDTGRQAELEARIVEGEFDFLILSPPCGSWSRLNYGHTPGPKLCRSKESLWGFPNSGPAQRQRAEQGNAFIHFCIRAIEAISSARRHSGAVVRVLWERPEVFRLRSGSCPNSDVSRAPSLASRLAWAINVSLRLTT